MQSVILLSKQNAWLPTYMLRHFAYLIAYYSPSTFPCAAIKKPCIQHPFTSHTKLIQIMSLFFQDLHINYGSLYARHQV
jgi:hypothetical protein